MPRAISGAAKSAVACAAVGAITRDPEITAAQLATWLTDVAGLAGVSVGALEIPAATGFSNETILFDAAWSEGDAEPDDAPAGRADRAAGDTRSSWSRTSSRNSG